MDQARLAQAAEVVGTRLSPDYCNEQTYRETYRFPYIKTFVRSFADGFETNMLLSGLQCPPGATQMMEG